MPPALGSDIAKISLDLRRPRPLCASRHHPEVMSQLADIARRIKKAIPAAEAANVKLALENHTESFASEILWLIDEVNHPLVGACVDTANAVMVLEDSMVAIEQLVPRSFTNHFCDHRIDRDQYGCRFHGVACGDGDIGMKRVYELIRDQSSMEASTLKWNGMRAMIHRRKPGEKSGKLWKKVSGTVARYWASKTQFIANRRGRED